MIVVDLGCKTIDQEESMLKLIARFQPELYYGFDPHPMLQEGVTVEGVDDWVGATVAVTRRLAAWTHDGFMPFVHDGTRSKLVLADGDEQVRCFDLVGWLVTLPPVPIVLKLDVEGAEYPLLRDLALRYGDRRLERVLVEWHSDERVELGCPVEEWL